MVIYLVFWQMDAEIVEFTKCFGWWIYAMVEFTTCFGWWLYAVVHMPSRMPPAGLPQGSLCRSSSGPSRASHRPPRPPAGRRGRARRPSQRCLLDDAIPGGFPMPSRRHSQASSVPSLLNGISKYSATPTEAPPWTAFQSSTTRTPIDSGTL